MSPQHMARGLYQMAWLDRVRFPTAKRKESWWKRHVDGNATPDLVGFNDEFFMDLPSGYLKIAIENGPFIVDLPNLKMDKNGDFP